MYLTAADYVVTVVIIIIPLAIGIYYAWKDAEDQTREVYLLGGRSMSMLPVSLSIFITYQSAITLMGVPSEVYVNGFMFIAFYISNSISCYFGSYLIVPLMYPLRLTSMYEYLEMRYQSKAVRKLATITGMVQTFFYMIIAMLAPGLAIQAAAGIPFWLSVVVVGCLGTFYTAIGGIKSVIWTDAFQSCVVFIGIAITLIIGIFKVGSLERIYDIAKAGGRTSCDEIGVDPRIRHSWWSFLIGNSVAFLTHVFNQSTLIRISSMKSISSARRAYALNTPMLLLYGTSLSLVGVVLYAYFSSINCDPIEGGLISNSNQIILVYIILIFKDYPGVAGIFMASIFSGALSTLSSGINSLATNTVEDIMGERILKEGLSEKAVTVIAKVLVFLYGIFIVILAYLAQSLQGSIIEMALSIFSVFGSVILGLIVVGFSVPWANSYGAITGAMANFGLTAWIAVGAQLYGIKAKPLPPLPTYGCSSLSAANNISVSFSLENATHTIISSTPTTLSTELVLESTPPPEYGFFLYDISYLWYALIGVLINCLVNLAVSKLTSNMCYSKPNANVIHPALRRYWKLEEQTDVSDHHQYLLKYASID